MSTAKPPRPARASKTAGRRAPARSRTDAKKGPPKPRARVETGPPRLQKLLAQAGIASRRNAEDLITQGRVKIDGKVITLLGTRVDPKLARIEVDGQLVLAQEPTYIVMNKPDEVVSSAEPTTDPRGRNTVVSLLGGLRTRVVPVGRLDYHTRGVLLLTNDGALHAALLHPRRSVPKTYHVKFQGKLGEEQLAQLHAGLRLEDGTRTRPSLEVELVKATTTNTWVQLTISQGLNRQVRRMGDAIGHSVLKLIRVAFAGITGDGLREGQWRHLKPEEVAGLYTLAGMKAPARDQEAPASTPRGTAVVRLPASMRAAAAAREAAAASEPPTRETPPGRRTASDPADRRRQTTSGTPTAGRERAEAPATAGRGRGRGAAKSAATAPERPTRPTRPTAPTRSARTPNKAAASRPASPSGSKSRRSPVASRKR